MTVSILSLSARGETDVAVTFEIREENHAQKEAFLVSAAMIADWGLRCGESTQDCYDAVSHASRVYKATKRGLYLLGFGSCSEHALMKKLIAKGESREVAQEAVAELRQSGYMNEFSDAAREAERCVAKEWGKRRIVDTLHTKGFSDEAIRAAIHALEDADVDYAELCASRIRNQAGTVPPDPAKRQKLIAALMRYGFSISEIKEAFSLIREEA